MHYYNVSIVNKLLVRCETDTRPMTPPRLRCVLQEQVNQKEHDFMQNKVEQCIK